MALLGGLAAFVWVANPHWLLIGASPAIVSQLTLRYIAQRNRKAEQLSSLDRLNRQLSTVLSHEEVFQAVSSQLRGLRSVEGSFVSLVHPTLHLAEGAAQRDSARRLAERAIASGELLAVNEPGDEAGEQRSWLILPLGRGSERLGDPDAVLGELPRAAARFLSVPRERVEPARNPR